MRQSKAKVTGSLINYIIKSFIISIIQLLLCYYDEQIEVEHVQKKEWRDKEDICKLNVSFVST